MAVESYSQMARLSLNVNNQSLENVSGTIEDNSEFFFLIPNVGSTFPKDQETTPPELRLKWYEEFVKQKNESPLSELAWNQQ